MRGKFVAFNSYADIVVVNAQIETHLSCGLHYS
jgi:hypothetical protein